MAIKLFEGSSSVYRSTMLLLAVCAAALQPLSSANASPVEDITTVDDLAAQPVEPAATETPAIAPLPVAAPEPVFAPERLKAQKTLVASGAIAAVPSAEQGLEIAQSRMEPVPAPMPPAVVQSPAVELPPAVEQTPAVPVVPPSSVEPPSSVDLPSSVEPSSSVEPPSLVEPSSEGTEPSTPDLPAEPIAPSPEASEASEPRPPFGTAGQGHWYVQGAAAAPIDGESHFFGLAGAGISQFFATGHSINAELNAMGFAQSGDDALGLNLAVLLRWHFIRQPNWSIYIDGGAGILGTTNPVPIGGSSFNFTPQVGGGTMIRLNDDNQLMVGVRWHHISNANLYENNPGRDTVMLYVGLMMPR